MSCGEVVAQPLDSKRIIVSGDAGDLDFLEQVLAMMDVSTPAAIINVFQLQYAKASALRPIIEKAVTARIETSTARRAREISSALMPRPAAIR